MTNDPVARYLAKRSRRFDARDRLRPMSPGEMIDLALRVYQRLGGPMLRISLVPTLFCLAGVVFVTEYALPGLTLTRDASNLNVQLQEALVALALALFIGGPLLLLGLGYTTSAVVQLVSDYLTGKVPDPEEAQTTSRRILPRIALVGLFSMLRATSGLLAAAGLMAIGALLTRTTASSDATAGLVALTGVLGVGVGIVVFLVVLGRDALTAPAAVLEDLKGGAAWRRSHELVRRAPIHGGANGAIWSIYVVLFFLHAALATGLGAVLVLTGIQDTLETWLEALPLAGLWIGAMHWIPGYLVTWAVVPFWATCITILYYDRRIRLEGYDIEALAAEIGRNPRANRFEL